VHLKLFPELTISTAFAPGSPEIVEKAMMLAIAVTLMQIIHPA
jgi:hypothetical protein